MNTNSTAGAIEKKARNLLSGIEVNCPEKVWLDISFELEQGSGSGEMKWKIKRSTLLITGLLIFITGGAFFFLWKYISEKGNNTVAVNNIVAHLQSPPPAPKSIPVPEHPLIPAAAVKDTVSKDTAVKKTSPLTLQPIQPNVVKDTGVKKPDTRNVSQNNRGVNYRNNSPINNDSLLRASKVRITQTSRKDSIAKRNNARSHSDLHTRRHSRTSANDTSNNILNRIIIREPFPADTVH